MAACTTYPGFRFAPPWAVMLRAFSAGTESQVIQSGSTGSWANL